MCDIPAVASAITKIMTLLLFNLLIIATGIYGLATGYRRGLTGQISSVLGFAFGAVAAHAFAPDAEAFMLERFPSLASRDGAAFVCSLFGCGAIYGFTYFFFRMMTSILRHAMSIFNVGLLDRLAGAIFSTIKMLTALSLLLNIYVCFHSDSTLVSHSRDDDGNLIELVMNLGPEIIGSLDTSEFALLLQLRDAKSIS